MAAGIFGCSAKQQKCPEIFELAEYIPQEMIPTEAKRHYGVHVNIDWLTSSPNLLLTFNIDPPFSIDPVFYIGEETGYGAGLKVRKNFPHDEAKLTYTHKTLRIDRGGLLKINASRHSHADDNPPGRFPVFFKKEGRSVIYQQWASISINPFPEYGLYTVTYEHPWEKINGGNMLFSSDKLLISRSSEKRSNELAQLFKDNPKLELASYKMKHPPVSEFPKYNRPVRFFDEYLKEGMLYDEVLYLMGSPDMVYHKGNSMSWHFHTSNVGGLSIHFVDGKITQKGFSFERS